MGVVEVNRAVFLDRDGVLNRTLVRDGITRPPAMLSELEILPGVEQALEELHAAGFVLVVVTNQPDVARGTQTRESVEEINRYLMDRLPLRDVLTCYHDNADNCLCRKPKPGMILDAAKRFGLSASDSYLVGDRWSDIVAGATAGCTTFLVEMPYSKAEKCRPDYVVRDLTDVAAIIQHLVSGARDASSHSHANADPHVNLFRSGFRTSS